MAGEIFVGSVAVGVVPDLTGWERRVRAELVPSAGRVGDEIGRIMGQHITANMGIGRDVEDSARRGTAQTASAGKRSGRTFSEGFKGEVDAELKRYDPEVHVEAKLDTAAARLELERLQHSGRNIGTGTGENLGRGLLGGIASAMSGAGGSGAGVAIPGLGAVSPAALAVGGALGIVALPIISVAVGGAIVAAFGGALSAMAIIGAARNPEVAKTFTDLKDRVLEDFDIIGQSWVPVLESIGNVARQTMDALTPVFSAAAKTISGPFKTFADTLITAFTQPVVKTSIKAVADAFSKILTAITPQIPGMVAIIANSITMIANAVAAHPDALAKFAQGMVEIAEAIAVTLAFLIRVGSYMITTFANNIASMKRTWNQAWTDMKNWATDIWNGIKSAWSATWNGLRRIFASFIVDGILGPLGTILHGAAVAFGWIPGIGGKLKTADKQFQEFTNSVNKSLGGINDQNVKVGVQMTAASNPYPGGISGRAAYGGYIGVGTGPTADDVPIWVSRGEYVMPSDAVSFYGLGFMNMLRGKKYAAGGPVEFNVSAVTPSADQVGRSLWAQTVKTVTAAFKNSGILQQMTGAGAGAGVGRWTGVVLQALGMLGLSSSLLGLVLRQMQSESGGNPNAINNWDSNAAMGDPSRGLMQTIGGTFTAYHVPGTSWNIFDPLANVAAALNYASHGRGFGTGPGQVGSGHGYADGGPILEPVIGVGLGSGSLYSFGEKGREWVTPGGRPREGSSVIYNANFDGLTGAAIESHVRTAFQAMSLTQGALQRQGRRD